MKIWRFWAHSGVASSPPLVPLSLRAGARGELPGSLLLCQRPGAGVPEAAGAPERGGHPEEQGHHGEPEQGRQHQRAELRGQCMHTNTHIHTHTQTQA